MTCQKNKKEFAERFTEVCGSSEAKEIRLKLGISYQAAKNYLEGRFPNPKVLMLIAEKTPYSIHWLLTGQGGKFVGDDPNLIQDTLLTASQTRRLIREELVKMLSEGLDGQNVSDDQISIDTEKTSHETARPQIIQLSTSQIKREKLAEENLVRSKNKINGTDE